MTLNFITDCYGFTEDELKTDNFELSNYWVYSEKSEKLKNLLKINNLNFDVEFLNLLCIADEEKYKGNIKNMNILIIKISSNNPKVVKYGCR
ncbi:hypothetical protein H8356DRAFT_1437395 [Neocallimastix lanati (nom. inval.)]|nr:hypothetical protein H8356DRAFT_1437395 [Neocallimastix sp. JGI-2020a]